MTYTYHELVSCPAVLSGLITRPAVSFWLEVGKGIDPTNVGLYTPIFFLALLVFGGLITAHLVGHQPLRSKARASLGDADAISNGSDSSKKFEHI
jgi:hypothetical protein